MSKRTLNDWASIAEIVGTVAVVISLVFVVLSVRQNTEQLRLQNGNYLYDQQLAALETMIAQPLLLEVLTKTGGNSELTPTERLRLDAFQHLAFSKWEMAYWWHREGVLADDNWESWDQLYKSNANGFVPSEDWETMRPAYTEEFASHVDQHYIQSN